jgi:hypothetical protein
MTSIYDIPYEDIKIFLKSNGESFKNKDEAYEITIDLLKDKKTKGHTISIIEWMIAHNLLKRKINIPNYTTYQIDNMSQKEINEIAKLLTMKGNNPENIKNILRFLHKLDEENISLLPEINDIILNTLYDIEKRNGETLLLIQAGSFRDIIELLKTHHNKRMIRELILDNMDEIVDNLSINGNYYIISFMVELLDNDELGLVKKFYDYLKLLDTDFKEINLGMYDSIYHQYGEYNILLERLFKIISSEDLFYIFTEKMKKVKNIDIRLEYFYIPFLETAIELQKLDLIILILDYFKEKSFEDLKKVKSVKTKTLIKEFEDLMVVAREMV